MKLYGVFLIVCAVLVNLYFWELVPDLLGAFVVGVCAGKAGYEGWRFLNG